MAFLIVLWMNSQFDKMSVFEGMELTLDKAIKIEFFPVGLLSLKDSVQNPPQFIIKGTAA